MKKCPLPGRAPSPGKNLNLFSMATLPSPLLVLVTGLPGAGKTTFSRALAKALDARHFNTDIIRSNLGLRGRYDERSKQEVYRFMEERVEEALRAGRRVVVDGTFYREALRASFLVLAGKNQSPACWIVIEAPEVIIKERVSQKREYSEADFEVYFKIRDSWEPLNAPHLTLQSGFLETMVERALAYISNQTKGP